MKQTTTNFNGNAILQNIIAQMRPRKKDKKRAAEQLQAAIERVAAEWNETREFVTELTENDPRVSKGKILELAEKYARQTAERWQGGKVTYYMQGDFI